MSRSSRSTGGFTLVELLVVVVLGVLILGAAYQVLAVQERAYRQQGAAITTQQTMRGAVEVLEAELREVSATGGDLTMISPDSLSFRAYRAVGFICSLDSPGQRIVLFQPGGQAFQTGGNLLYFIESDPNTGADDGWGLVAINQVDSGTCDAAWGSGAGPRLNIPGFDFANTALGAPVRSFEPYTYGLFQVGGEWVLARRGPADPSPIPLIGPLAPSPNGIQFQYLDANGAATTNAAQVASIQIVVRGRTQGTGVPGQTHYTDSLVTQLFLRNNR